MVEFNPGGAASLNAAVLARLLANPDTNQYTNAERAKLLALPVRVTQVIPVPLSDQVTPLIAGAAKFTFRMPFNFTLTGIRASVATAPTGATRLAVDVNMSGATILSTKLTFDASEKTTVTSSIPPVISNVNLLSDAEMTFDIDAVGNTIAGAGLIVYLIGFVPE